MDADATYLRLLNSEQHDHVEFALLESPVRYEMHWDREGGQRGRSRLCVFDVFRRQGVTAPRDLCRGCKLEWDTFSSQYTVCWAPARVEVSDVRRCEYALVQIPLVLVAGEHAAKIKRGRIIRVHGLGGKCKPRWQLGGITDPERLPPTVDPLPHLMRITGLARLPELGEAIPTGKVEQQDSEEAPDVIQFSKYKSA